MASDRPIGRLVVPSLVLSRVVFQPYTLITMLMLIEIARTFNVPVGVAGLLSTSASIMVVLGSLAMSYMAIRVNNRHLMLAGLGLYFCSFVACSLSPAFPVLLLVYAALGVARSMVDPMTSSYVGRLLPQEKRAGVISLFFASMAGVVLLISPFIGYASSLWGWRILFILFALPFSAAALALVWLAIPSSPQEVINPGKGIMAGFKRIAGNRSAIACLACTLLSETTWSITVTYGISYIRQRFTMSAGDASYFLIGTSLCFMAGSLSGGRLVNRLGRKMLAILSTLALGILTLLYLNLGLFWASAAAMLFACVFSAMRYTVAESLILEQIPDMRGTVMSLNSIAMGLGGSVGSAVGGFTQLSFGYGGMGAFGLLALVASLIYRFYAVDPATES